MRTLYFSLALLVVWLGLLGLALGWPFMNTGVVWDDTLRQIVWELRLPRLALATLCGALLAASGATVQAQFRNALAEPSLLGVSGGAALGAATSLALGGSLVAVSAWAFLGAMLTLVLVRLLTGGFRDDRLILAGIAVNAMASSALMLLMSILPEGELRQITFWLMGSFAYASWPQVVLLSAICGLVLLSLHAAWPFLAIMQLGEAAAYYAGFSLKRWTWWTVSLAALATAAVVSLVGMVGFVGLMSPHIARRFVASNHVHFLWLSAAVGAVLTVLADTLAARLLDSTELPVGVLTALAGAPFFLFLLLRLRKT
jgi:iron complex transport system permease protein